MSDYIIKDGKKVRACKYTCGQMLAWDSAKNYFAEVNHDNVQHTPDRCKAFKEIKQDPKKDKAVETLKEIVNEVKKLNDILSDRYLTSGAKKPSTNLNVDMPKDTVTSKAEAVKKYFYEYNEKRRKENELDK